MTLTIPIPLMKGELIEACGSLIGRTGKVKEGSLHSNKIYIGLVSQQDVCLDHIYFDIDCRHY
jgi:hypothetical protein